MKYIVLILSVVSLLKAEEDLTGGVSVDKKLKITDRIPTGNCKITIQDNDLVTFEAYGYNLDGKRFDSGQYEHQIGHNELMKGIEEGIKGLCYGQERSLKIHPDWAFGTKGLPGRVDANATIIYDIKINNIERENVTDRRGIQMQEFLRFKDTNVVEDCGMKVKGGDRIKWRYSGKLTDGTVFDEGDFNAVIDKREVIQGVNEAMKGLCVGGKRTMLMHHSYGYGARGTGNIPGYANLVFDVYLYSINRPDVGLESIETKLRKADVSEEDPIKITDRIPTGFCTIKAREGDIVTWFYHGYLLTGRIFDQGQEEAAVNNITPPGLNKALVGLCVGDERSITLHTSVAYGSKGRGDKVPINATVIYDVKILNIARTLTSSEANSTHGVDENTGLKPNQKLKIEVIFEPDVCTIKSKEGDTIHWNYQGAFLDGTLFHKGNFTATLGKGQIINGVDRGMRDMCIGEKRRLTVHSDWGYGNEGRPGTIPPRATLVFNNELTNIERPTEEANAEL